jgi:hypothetical protein
VLSFIRSRVACMALVRRRAAVERADLLSGARVRPLTGLLRDVRNAPARSTVPSNTATETPKCNPCAVVVSHRPRLIFPRIASASIDQSPPATVAKAASDEAPCSTVSVAAASTIPNV